MRHALDAAIAEVPWPTGRFSSLSRASGHNGIVARLLQICNDWKAPWDPDYLLAEIEMPQ